MDDFDYDRAAYRQGLEAKDEGYSIESNPFDQEYETSEWLSWRRGFDAGQGNLKRDQ